MLDGDSLQPTLRCPSQRTESRRFRPQQEDARRKQKFTLKGKQKQQKSRCWSVSEKKNPHQAANKASVASVHMCFGCCQTRADWEECLWTGERWISARGSFHGAAGDKRQTFYKSTCREQRQWQQPPSWRTTFIVLRHKGTVCGIHTTQHFLWRSEVSLALAVWDVGVIILLMGSWKAKLLNCCFHFF